MSLKHNCPVCGTSLGAETGGPAGNLLQSETVHQKADAGAGVSAAPQAEPGIHHNPDAQKLVKESARYLEEEKIFELDMAGQEEFIRQKITADERGCING